MIKTANGTDPFVFFLCIFVFVILTLTQFYKMFFSSTEADQHAHLQQSVVRKR